MATVFPCTTVWVVPPYFYKTYGFLSWACQLWVKSVLYYLVLVGCGGVHVVRWLCVCTVYLWVVNWRYCIYWLYFVVGMLYTVCLNVCLFFVFISTVSVLSIVGVMVGTLRVAWSEEEDAVLRVLVGLHGCRWDAVAGGLVGRSAESARFRWRSVRLVHVVATVVVALHGFSRPVVFCAKCTVW